MSFEVTPSPIEVYEQLFGPEYVDRFVRAIVVTARIRATLRQREYWIDRSGRRISLDEIDARYARNIVRFLERRAKALRCGEEGEYLFGPRPTAEMAADEFDREFDVVLHADPIEWLHGQPLVLELEARIQDAA